MSGAVRIVIIFREYMLQSSDWFGFCSAAIDAGVGSDSRLTALGICCDFAELPGVRFVRRKSASVLMTAL